MGAIAQLSIVIARPPTEATKTIALQGAGGEALDYTGMCSAAMAALTQAKETLLLLTDETDEADPNAAIIINILDTLL
jgi:hypothetical protein